MISTDQNLDYLLERVNRLKSLLEDPHPGLSTWCEACGRAMDAIVEFGSDDLPAKDTEKPSNERTPMK